jgi:hypothetical protein
VTFLRYALQKAQDGLSESDDDDDDDDDTALGEKHAAL